MKQALLLLSSFAFAFGDYTPEALADQIKNLPGAENLDFKFNQFSGYVKVNLTKNMHYWFVESSRAPDTDPIAFWTNGGPGCSGLLGFLTEMGPFRPNKDMTLSLNPYSWNTIANMVFIEQPCGVGFSYSDNPDGDDYHNSDAQAAKDNFALVQAFFDRFPQYRKNDLYITSESYGGHYMPTLAKEIVDRNTAGNDPQLNFKGLMVGNPATTFYSAIGAGLDTYWGHQIVSKPLWDSYKANCKNILDLEACEMYYMAMYKEIGNLNPYALDYPVCTEDTTTAKGFAHKYGRGQRAWFMNHMLNSLTMDENGRLSESRAKTLKALQGAIGLEPIDGYEPCADDYMTSYLNLDNVKAAIHVKNDIKWLDCSRTIRYKQTDGKNDMTPYYNYLIDGGYKLNILVFSGDDDDVCSTIGTQSWIWDLGYEVAGKPWQMYTVNGQVAGYITKWTNTKFAFATVRGAGHEVPTYKPQEALWLWDAYLKGEITNA